MSDSKQQMAEALRLRREQYAAEAAVKSKPAKVKRDKVSRRTRWSS